MRKRITLVFLLVFVSLYSVAQAQLTKQRKLKKWAIPSANFSGITPLGDNRYAVVSDKQSSDGWSEMRIVLDEKSGKIRDVEYLGFHASPTPSRDAEDIVFTGNNIYICAEDDQRILEYDMNGVPTGRELPVPEQFSRNHIVGNYGFEALAYSTSNKTFYTCTENTLKSDGAASSYENKQPAKIRILSFDENYNAVHQYLYITDVPKAKKAPKQMAFGVPAMTALDDGSLLVLEREFFVANKYIGSYVTNKIYRVVPSESKEINSDQNLDEKAEIYAMQKTFIAEWTTRLNLTRRGIANYEGMCLGPKLKDGRQTILLISDSQGGYGNSMFHLKDYIKVIILD